MRAIYSLTATIASISTEIWLGSMTLPTADRAWRPASPKTSMNRSEQPLITFGESLKSGTALTMPRSFTTKSTRGGGDSLREKLVAYPTLRPQLKLKMLVGTLSVEDQCNAAEHLQAAAGSGIFRSLLPQASPRAASGRTLAPRSPHK